MHNDDKIGIAIIIIFMLIFPTFIYFIFDYFRPCWYMETCGCGSTQPWIRRPQGAYQDGLALKAKLKERLYGQPLVVEELSVAVANHINKKNPSRALAVSLHGLAGTGKSYTGKIVAEFLYTLGMKSKFAHIFLGGIRNCGDAGHCLRNHQEDIHNTIISTLQWCPKALFIVDEVDDMPTGVLNSLMSFLDEQSDVFGVDPRQSIFFFLSNSGSEEIASKTMEYHLNNTAKKDIPASEIEKIVRNSAYAKAVKNEHSGFKQSQLLSRNLIQFHIPYFPLTRSEVEDCIRYYLKTKDSAQTENFIKKAVAEIEFTPFDNPTFSIYGCRPVEKVVDRLIMDQNKQQSKTKKKGEL